MPDVQEVFRMATQKVRPDPGALERQNRNQRRRRTRERAGGYVLLALLVIAAVVIGFLGLRSREQRPAGQGEQEPSAAELATHPHFLDLGTGETRLLPDSLAGGYSYVASPDGTRVAYSSKTGGGCADGGVTVANIDGTDVRTLQPPEGFVSCAPRWSPDGTKIVYQQRADTEDSVGNLFVYDLATGQKTQITDLELTRAWWYFLSPSFNAYGQHVLFHLPRSSSETTRWDVWSVPVTGGEPSLVLRNATFPIDRGEGPEGLLIQFLLPGTNDFSGQSLMTARPVPESDIRHTLVEANNSIWWPTISPDRNRIAYQDGGSIYVIEIYPGSARGEPSNVAVGSTAEWLDNDTLIVAP
jgi:Tol biopolymer transport system component